MDNFPSPTLWAIPFFIISFAAEWLWSKKSNRVRYDSKDAITSLLMGSGSVAVGIMTGAIVMVISLWAYQYRLFTVEMSWANAIWLAPLVFILDDLAYYWFHRTAHRVRWFWAAHVIHHSSQYYNLTTALRQTWTGFFAIGFIFRLPLFFIGFAPALIFFIAGINLIYQYWIHTEAIDKCPRWFEAVMNTPSHHRVQQATKPR